MSSTSQSNRGSHGAPGSKGWHDSDIWSRRADDRVLPSKVDEMFSTLADCATWLVQRATDGMAEDADFERLSTMLAALPLATDQYGLFALRLENALAYYVTREWGAAGYELQLLSGGVSATAAKNNGCSQP